MLKWIHRLFQWNTPVHDSKLELINLANALPVFEFAPIAFWHSIERVPCTSPMIQWKPLHEKETDECKDTVMDAESVAKPYD